MNDDASKYQAVLTYKGYTIGVTRGSFLFQCPEIGQTERSLDEIKTKIEKYLLSQKAEERAKANKALHVPVLLGSGKHATVTGINARTGGLNGVGEENEVYPVIPWIERALKAKADAYVRAKAIDDQVRKYRVFHSTWGRIDPENYVTRVERFRKELADVEAKAKAAPVPAEWATEKPLPGLKEPA